MSRLRLEQLHSSIVQQTSPARQVSGLDRLESLSLSERIEHYRNRAGRMMRLAEIADSDRMRLAYLKLAAHWQDLILDLEQGRVRRAELPELDEGLTALRM